MYKVTKFYTATIPFIHSSGDSSPWLSRSTPFRPDALGLGQHIMAGICTHILSRKRERKTKKQGVPNPIY